jgi:hypothetical protein
MTEFILVINMFETSQQKEHTAIMLTQPKKIANIRFSDLKKN